MKLTAIALVAVFALSATGASAQTDRHMSHVHHYRNAYGMSNERQFQLQPNNGDPNGRADGPTTLSGTGSSKFGGNTPGTSGDF
jgi:hypothetical protein